MAPQTICVATSGHLSTCPRLVKAARAFTEDGYHVRVVSSLFVDHYRRMDIDLVGREGWEWDAIEWGRDDRPSRWLGTGVRFRLAERATSMIGPHGVPYSVALAAFSRLHAELADRISRRPADLYYGGGGGAIAAVSVAAARRAAPFAVDLEDFHLGQVPDHSAGQGVIERVERRTLRDAAFVTAGSPAIADAYQEKYGLTPVAICNTFSLPASAPALEPQGSAPLRLYWFSQTIGPGRGLETVVDALGVAGVAGELHLRGSRDAAYVDSIRCRAANVAPAVQLELHSIESPERMVDLCRGYDVGLSVEPGSSMNNRLALSNKALTYPLAGLALVLTNTPGHRPLIDDLGGDALVYEPGDVDALARGLHTWSADRSALRRARAASWGAAERRWHWEGNDREALLAAVQRVVERNSAENKCVLR